MISNQLPGLVDTWTFMNISWRLMTWYALNLKQKQLPWSDIYICLPVNPVRFFLLATNVDLARPTL